MWTTNNRVQDAVCERNGTKERFIAIELISPQIEYKMLYAKGMGQRNINRTKKLCFVMSELKLTGNLKMRSSSVVNSATVLGNV